jgi:hypothetical protein
MVLSQNNQQFQMEVNLLYSMVSIFLTFIVLAIIKVIERIKFKTLSGSHKATGVIIIISITEVIYLSMTLKILSSAIEIVTSLSAILLFFTFVYLNKLQNAVSGMSLSLGRRANIGNKIEFVGEKGTIIQIGLTKTIVKLDGTNRQMLIPSKSSMRK